MPDSKLRQQIAFAAARLMYFRQESEYYRAKLKAAEQLMRQSPKPRDLPSNQEVHEQIQSFARMFEGDARKDRLREMRLAALQLMRELRAFRPRVIDSVLKGTIREGSDIDIQLISPTLEPIEAVLSERGVAYDVLHKPVRRGEQTIFYRHIHIDDKFPFELTVYAGDEEPRQSRDSITGKAIERASIAEFEQLLQEWYPGIDLDEEGLAAEWRTDRFVIYAALLWPLESVKQGRKYHPEGDALYHSLQVFDLACDAAPYDEDLLLAALLHDVGKAIDKKDHVRAGLEALGDSINGRTAWLIAHHMEAHQLHDGTLGARARRRLRESEWYEDLLVLEECDREGRQAGVAASQVDEALDYIRDLGARFA